ncbi:MAG: hypothetical protein AAGG75_16940 [Bacteroidota bacterium]
MYKFTSLVIIGLLLVSCGNTPVAEKPLSYSPNTIQEATLFAPGVISTENNSEFEIMFTPDGERAYFCRRAPEKKQKIYETTFVNGDWTTPRVCDFSVDRDETASITPDGNLFFFGSERPIPDRPNQGAFDMNIWMMKKTGDRWGTPVPLPAPINEVQVEGEQWPSSNNNFLSAVDNETFYYTTMVRGSKAIKLYQTQYRDGTFSEPEEIKGLFEDEKYWIYSPVVSPDGKYLFFNSFAVPGGAGGEDIYVAQKTAEGWSKAQSIGPKINSKNEEGAPRFSRDGKYFFFSRSENLGNDEYGEWSLYFIETAFLELENLFD